jgi:hypothetical protein
MDRLEQSGSLDTGRTETTNESDCSHIVKIPSSLHSFIFKYKESIGTGLYYLALGNRSGDTEEHKSQQEPSDKKESLKSIRFKLSPTSEQALEKLQEDGYSKKDAVIAAIEYLKTKPATIFKVKI